MPPPTSHWSIPLAAGLGAPIALYLTFILLGSFPFFQRQFLYAHKLNTLFWHDVNQPEYWGFANNQVTPFTLTTPDGETLYSWYILPLQTYLKNEASLETTTRSGFSDDITSTEAFKILRNDPDARVIISFHGNAGHIAQNVRPDSFHAMTDTSAFYVLTLDYRGFGHSTGSPDEAGLILDGATAVRWVVDVAGVPPERVLIVGQSLGTAVAAGVVEYLSSPSSSSLISSSSSSSSRPTSTAASASAPASSPSDVIHNTTDGGGGGGEKVIDGFAGVILIAGFSSLPNLLSSYMGGGVVPVLRPFRPFPPLLRLLQSFVVEKWPSADRLARLVERAQQRQQQQEQEEDGSDSGSGSGRLHLTLIHAKNDREIPCSESDVLFRAAAGATAAARREEVLATDDDVWFAEWKEARTRRRADGTFVTIVEDGPDVVIREEIVRYGGHNDVMLSSPVHLAIMRSFGLKP